MFELESPGQSIQIVSPRLGTTAYIMARLYHATSTANMPEIWQGYPKELDPVLQCLCRGLGREDFKSIPAVWTYPEPAPRLKDKVLVGFSGGKDATAVVLKLRRAGKKVELFYTRGINRAYPGEYDACVKIANALRLPLHVMEVRVVGKQDWVENPMKNQFILGCMVDYGSRVGIAEYVQGGLECDTCETQAFGSGYSDGREMFEATQSFFQTVYPDYLYHYSLLKNDTDSFLTVLKEAPQLIPMIHSCMGPLRYKANLRRTNETKYNIELMPNRCGSCYKCSLEALHLHMVGEKSYPPAFIQHCYDVMITALGRILGPGKYGYDEVHKEFFDKDLINSYRRN